jgi:predicted ATP-dependent serine protease
MGAQSVQADLERLEGRPSVLRTGFPALDRALGGGFSTTSLTLLAERPDAHGFGVLLESVRKTLARGRPVMVLSEGRRESAVRDELIAREARVNRFRFDAGLVSAEDRIAMAGARRRIHWEKLVVVAGRSISLPEIDEMVFSYRPWLVIADLKPRAPQASRPRRVDSWVEGAQRLASMARRHRSAMVLLQRLAAAEALPGLAELPGRGAAAEVCATVLGLSLDDAGTKRRLKVLQLDGERASTEVKLTYDARLGR